MGFRSILDKMRCMRYQLLQNASFRNANLCTLLYCAHKETYLMKQKTGFKKNYSFILA